MEYPIWLVVVMGLGVVFTGLISIIIISTVMSAVIRLMERKKPQEKLAAPDAAEAAMTPEEKGKFVAAVSAAVAEELGTSPEAIRITSIKRI